MANILKLLADKEMRVRVKVKTTTAPPPRMATSIPAIEFLSDLTLKTVLHVRELGKASSNLAILFVDKPCSIQL